MPRAARRSGPQEGPDLACGVEDVRGQRLECRQKRFNPGFAARNAVTAALLAQAGVTGEETVLEGERGFGSAFAGGLDQDVLLAGLGRDVPITVEHKPYACVRPIHAALDAAVLLRDEHGLRPADLETITVHRHPDWSSYFGARRPRSFHEAQVSLPYAFAVALVHGQAPPERFASPGTDDAEVQSVADRLVLVVDGDLPSPLAARVEVRTADGRDLVVRVDHPRGSRENPLSDDDLEVKVRRLLDPLLGPDRAAAVVTAVRALPEVPDLRPLVTLLTPA